MTAQVKIQQHSAMCLVYSIIIAICRCPAGIQHTCHWLASLACSFARQWQSACHTLDRPVAFPILQTLDGCTPNPGQSAWMGQFCTEGTFFEVNDKRPQTLHRAIGHMDICEFETVAEGPCCSCPSQKHCLSCCEDNRGLCSSIMLSIDNDV